MSLRQRPTSSPNPPSTSAAAVIPPPSTSPPPTSQSALSQALRSTAHLANLLPTGTLLAFQLLTPIFTNSGACDAATRPVTAILLVILSLSCFLACFTDSIKLLDGKVYYGFSTFKGLWLFDFPAAAAAGPLPDMSKYRLNFIDAVHAVSSVLVFVAVALRDKNVTSCFYPTPGLGAEEVLIIGPIGIGFVCSLLFVIFPTRRHGIGYPVTRD